MTNNENIGRTIGRYKLLEEIGRGGMAIVYRALDTTLEREVALKLLHPYLTSHGESRTRFKREAQAVARLRHDSVLEIYDYSAGETGDVFIVMEIVQGTTLRRLLEKRNGEPLPAEAAALIMRPVCAALAHAHENGVVHRDVKPENILIGPEGEIKLSDFGIAHMAGVSQMTVTGQILGSPAYMSPEHVEMAELDARADIFSVGIILYEASIGYPPFKGVNPHAVLKKIVESKYDDPTTVSPGIGYHLSQLIQKCLERDPGDRFKNAAELIAALDDTLSATGCDAPKEGLKHFFTDPDGWMKEKKPQIIQQTLHQGLLARRKKRQKEAIDHFNRVLALDPGNEKALEAVAGMNRRRRIRTVLERVAVIIPAIVALSAVGWGLTHTPTPLSPPKGDTSKPIVSPDKSDSAATVIPKQVPEPVPDASVANVEQPVEKSETEPRATRISKLIKRVKPDEEPELREVVFTPHPMAVEVVIDGDISFPFGPGHQSQTLPVGEHTISFVPKDDKRFIRRSWTVTVPEGTGPYQFRKRLQWRPATVLVESNVEASVTIPGRATDSSNKMFSVTIENGPSEEVSVLVSRDGYVPQTKRLIISAGEVTKMTVNLESKTASP